MTTPYFYFSLNDLAALAGLECGGKEYTGKNFTVDIIELPFYLINTCDDFFQTVKVYLRNETCTHGDVASDYRGLINGKFGETNVDSQIDKSLEKFAAPFYVICDRIRCYIQDNSLEELYGTINPERSGILIYNEQGRITHRVVSGRERPEMKCIADDRSGVKDCRPYADEKEPVFDVSETAAAKLGGIFGMLMNRGWDYRFHIRFTDSEAWRKWMTGQEIEGSEGRKYTLLDICDPEKVSAISDPVGDIFDSLTADGNGFSCLIRDGKKPYEFYNELTRKLFDSAVSVARSNFSMIADLTDVDSDMAGEHIAYYLGDGDRLRKHVIPDDAGLRRHETDISDFKKMLEGCPLSPAEEERLRQL